MRTRVIVMATGCLALGALSLGVSAAPATSDGGDRSAEPSLPHPTHGQQAIRLLGDQLDEAAALNGWTSAQLRSVLATDSTAWVDRTGRVYYKDLPALADGATPDGTDVAPFPLPNTFLLHSNPTSTKKLFIDFNGTTVSGTEWNSPPNSVPPGSYPAWDPDANGAAFTDSEKEKIQAIWQRVAEDYAPFEVDVTTEDPTDGGIIRTDANDQAYGTRALVTPSTSAEGAICGTPVPSCGGVAYINVFGAVEPGGQHQPAWVFPQSLSQNSKNIAEAITHEVGHNLSLSHDGITNGANQGAPCSSSLLAYYCGHDQWAPIMGAGYHRPVTQWSKGEYTTANQGQDDVAAIAARVPYRTDEAGGTLATASTTTTGTRYITQATDQDLYLLGTCTGSLTLSAAAPAPATPSPDLDIRLELLDSAGTVVASNNPPSAFVSVETASGLTASITQAVTGGSYFLRVDGVGVGTPQTGYSDYSSIGAYALAVSGGVCTAPAGAPAAPMNVVATGNGPAGTAAVSWATPANIGGGAVTSYNVYVNGALQTTSTTLSATVTGLVIGTAYDVGVSAVNALGAGPQAHASPFTRLARPSAAAITKAKRGKKGGKKTASVAWSAPSTTGGLPITGYQVIVVKAKNGKVVKTANVAGSTTSYVAKLKAGKYKFAVVALNSLGAGPRSAMSKAVKAR